MTAPRAPGKVIIVYYLFTVLIQDMIKVIANWRASWRAAWIPCPLWERHSSEALLNSISWKLSKPCHTAEFQAQSPVPLSCSEEVGGGEGDGKFQLQIITGEQDGSGTEISRQTSLEQKTLPSQEELLKRFRTLSVNGIKDQILDEISTLTT